MKNMLIALLCVVLSLTVFTACNRSADGSVTVTVYFLGAAVSQDADVVEAANARLRELGLNITFNPIWGDWGASEKIQNVLDTGDTSIDIVFTCSWAVNYVPNALRGNFLRLDDPHYNLLGRYGQDIKAAIPKFLWDGFKVNTIDGLGIYAVPGYKDYAQMHTWDINNTRLAELGYDINSFNWDGSVIFDPRFEEAMAAAKRRYGANFYPLLPEPDNFLRALTYNDIDITGLGVIGFPFDPTNPAMPRNINVGLIYEDENVMAVLQKLHEFYQKGYIDPRVAIREEANAAISGSLESANYLFSQRTYAYGFSSVASNERGIDAKFMPISKPIISTVPVQGSGYGISVYSRNRKAAMQFLNVWYTDRQLAAILAYGVEGDHFTTNNDGTITLNVERRAVFSPWRNGMGNIFILPPQDVEGVNYYEEFKAYNNAGIGTTFLGFTFDPTRVINELAAIRNVRDEFQASVSTGVANPNVRVPEFIAKLNANGMQKVLTEVNSQLQMFYASR